MFDSPRSPVGLTLNQLAAARQALASVDMAAMSSDELLEMVAALEIDTRQRAAVTRRDRRGGYGVGWRPSWGTRPRRYCCRSG